MVRERMLERTAEKAAEHTPKESEHGKGSESETFGTWRAAIGSEGTRRDGVKGRSIEKGSDIRMLNRICINWKGSRELIIR